MKRHFSSRELFVLRNHIPIDTLIEKHLMLPSKFSEGYFRFLCPLCNKFQTAERNFNTIDMVIICKGLRFVEGVKYLKNILNNCD
jgi:hypothetical protein